MTELFEPLDESDRRIALHAEGPLSELNRDGVLTAADVHVAARLGRLAGETDPAASLATALAVRATRLGSVCVDLGAVSQIAPGFGWPERRAWHSAMLDSALVRAGAVRVEGDLVYLDRYWAAEGDVVADITARVERGGPPIHADRLSAALDEAFPGDKYAEQRLAAERCVRSYTSVLTGGPGTGKTTTLARLLAVLTHVAGRRLRIALAAPTGKAAARMTQSVVRASQEPDFPEHARDLAATWQASTIHRLLGVRPDNGTRFRRHRGNRLSADVVVVDETSMVSLTMMARLLEALRPETILILVGDPDQLASVEAGAVLKDLVQGLQQRGADVVSRLEQPHRFAERARIGDLAKAVTEGRPDDAWQLLADDSAGIDLIDPTDTASIQAAVLPPATRVWDAARSGDEEAAAAALDAHRLLCAHREGPFGVAHWNRLVEGWLMQHADLDWLPRWYPGQPLLVNANDYGLRLWNGDTGVVMRAAESADRALEAYFPDLAGGRRLALSRLPEVQTAHAMTVHRSQGSQFREVTVLLPEHESLVLTRQLLYTAVTRAEEVVRIIGTEAAVRAAIDRVAQRASGLSQRLARA